MDRLAGKTAVVTGAGRGIGRKIAEMFSGAGARVLACDINDKTIATLGGDGYDIQTCCADLTTKDGATSLASKAKELFGRVDILVNAAAVTRFAPLADMTLDDWNLTLQGEISSVFLVTQAVWPLMMKSGNASVINFSSVNAHEVLPGLSAIAHTAGKGAVLAMTRQIAMEGGTLGIRANTIAPGFIVTEETAQHMESDLMAKVRAKIMLVDRLGETQDIGFLAIYLGSDEAGFVTGADFSIDGGTTAW